MLEEVTNPCVLLEQNTDHVPLRQLVRLGSIFGGIAHGILLALSVRSWVANPLPDFRSRTHPAAAGCGDGPTPHAGVNSPGVYSPWESLHAALDYLSERYPEEVGAVTTRVVDEPIQSSGSGSITGCRAGRPTLLRTAHTRLEPLPALDVPGPGRPHKRHTANKGQPMWGRSSTARACAAAASVGRFGVLARAGAGSGGVACVVCLRLINPRSPSVHRASSSERLSVHLCRTE
ncbi:MAG: hypothetical protein JWQ93_2834 [Marmoricola sp.]|nr:hypothetical protein [Marmoricola sp.]